MRSFARLRKFTGILCVFALTITGLAIASGASAADPEFLGAASGNTFMAESGESEFVDLASGLAVRCKKDKGPGQVTGAKTLTSTVSFEKCTIGGLATQSLGDKLGTILLVNLPGKLCIVQLSPLTIGVLFTLPSEGVHIEAPSLGQLLVVKGSVVGLAEPINVAQTGTFTLTFVDPNLRCEGATGEEDILLFELEHNGEPLLGSEVSTEKILFAKIIEIMG